MEYLQAFRFDESDTAYLATLTGNDGKPLFEAEFLSYLEQLYTFGDLGRDPRERVISETYYALVNLEGHDVRASTDARNAAWFSINDLPELAFDHEMILNAAHERLKSKVGYQPIGFELLPEKFTALDAVDLGFKTTILTEGIRGVDLDGTRQWLFFPRTHR